MLCLFFLSCLFSFKNQFTEASSFIRVINPLHWSGLSFDKEGNMSLWKHIEQLIESVEGFEKQACSQVSRNTQKSTAELAWREGSLPCGLRGHHPLQNQLTLRSLLPQVGEFWILRFLQLPVIGWTRLTQLQPVCKRAGKVVFLTSGVWRWVQNVVNC